MANADGFPQAKADFPQRFEFILVYNPQLVLFCTLCYVASDWIGYLLSIGPCSTFPEPWYSSVGVMQQPATLRLLSKIAITSIGTFIYSGLHHHGCSWAAPRTVCPDGCTHGLCLCVCTL